MSCLLLFSILFSLTVLCGTLFSNQLLFLIFKVDLYLRLKANKLQHGHAFVLPTFAQRLFVVHSFPVCNFALCDFIMCSFVLPACDVPSFVRMQISGRFSFAQFDYVSQPCSRFILSSFSCLLLL